MQAGTGDGRREGLVLRVEQPELSVDSSEPDTRVIFNAVLVNGTDRAMTQQVGVEGIDQSWVEIPFDTTREALPGDSRGITVSVTVPPNSPGNRIRFNITAEGGGERTTAECNLQIVGPIHEGDENLVPPGVNLIPAEAHGIAGADQAYSMTFTVGNATETEAAYLISVHGLPQGWVDPPPEVHVPRQSSRDYPLQIRPTLTADPGDYRFTIRAAVSGAPTVASEATGVLTLEERTEEVEEEQPEDRDPTVLPPTLVLDPVHFEIGSGQQTAQAIIDIRNPSERFQNYTIEVTDLPPRWYTLSQTEVEIEAGGNRQIPINIAPRPSVQHPAGNYRFGVRVVPRAAPASFAETGALLEIEAGVISFDALVAPVQARGRSETFKFTLRNTGMEEIGLVISGSDRAGMCRFDIPPPPTLEQGEARVLRMKVGARRNRFVGYPQPLDFSLSVGPTGGLASAQREFNSTLVHEPYFTPRSLKWSLIAMFVAIVIGIVWRIGPDRVINEGFDWLKCRVPQLSGESCPPVVPRVPNLPQNPLGFEIAPAYPGGDYTLVARSDGDARGSADLPFVEDHTVNWPGTDGVYPAPSGLIVPGADELTLTARFPERTYRLRAPA